MNNLKTNLAMSYTTSSSIPIKMLKKLNLMEDLEENKYIPPYHVQFVPTNKCNITCPFCCCSEVDRNIEMPLEKIKDLILNLSKCGTKSVTITGGGEPLTHPDIEKIISLFVENNISVGLVCNGTLLHTVDSEILNKIKWCRISNGDHRSLSGKYKENLVSVINKCKDVDWAFSHVVSKNPNIEEICRIINLANIYNFTHVRLVGDLLDPDSVIFSAILTKLEELRVDLSRVIFQPRQQYEQGEGECLLGLLKPFIGANGNIYACSGVQFAFDKPTKDLPDELCIGTIDDFISKATWKEKIASSLNGKQCKKCYYGDYNRTLKKMLVPIAHNEFI